MKLVILSTSGDVIAEYDNRETQPLPKTGDYVTIKGFAYEITRRDFDLEANAVSITIYPM